MNKNISNKTVDMNDYETRKALQCMSSEELRKINKYVVGILKTRKASKIAEVKKELVEG